MASGTTLDKIRVSMLVLHARISVTSSPTCVQGQNTVSYRMKSMSVIRRSTWLITDSEERTEGLLQVK